jgi:glycosyltransferase involved in cell wall biosynthesis
MAAGGRRKRAARSRFTRVIRASVIVPAQDAEATLPRTLAALADQEEAPSFEVLVADGGSRDGTAAIAERAGARLVRLDGASTAEARNAAVAAASGALLAFCGADCRPSPAWLAAGTLALADAELVQGRVLADPAAPPGPFDRPVAVTAETGLYDARNLFVTRALFDRLGGFERAPGGEAPAEDVWFAWRARRGGARTVFCAEAQSHRPATPLEPLVYLEDATKLRLLPQAVSAVPELRETLLHRRLFVNRRTMKLDLAVAGLALAVARRSKLPLLAAAPYALELRRHAKRGGDDRIRVAAVDAATDVLGLMALLHGSVETRTPVL